MLSFPKLFCGISLGMLVFFAQPSHAQDANFQVNGTVAASCVFQTSDVHLGEYDAVSSQTGNLEAMGSLNVKCTKSATTIRISMMGGLNPVNPDGAGRCADQQMVSENNEKLIYQVLRGDHLFWGCYRGKYIIHTPDSSVDFTTHNFYISAPRGQNVGVGTFTDTITVYTEF